MNQIKALAVFVPEIGPLEGEINAALDAVAKARIILAPLLARVEAGQPAFLEAADEAPRLEAMLPELGAALRTFDKLAALCEAYMARLRAAGTQ